MNLCLFSLHKHSLCPHPLCLFKVMEGPLGIGVYMTLAGGWGWNSWTVLELLFWNCFHLCGRGAGLGCSLAWRTPRSTSSSRGVCSWYPLLNPNDLASLIKLGFLVTLALPWFLLCCGYPWRLAGTPCCDCFCETPGWLSGVLGFWVPTTGPEGSFGELTETFPQGCSHQCFSFQCQKPRAGQKSFPFCKFPQPLPNMSLFSWDSSPSKGDWGTSYLPLLPFILLPSLKLERKNFGLPICSPSYLLSTLGPQAS